ncbi:hypothetical protein ACWEKM_37650 [Streptomyces sp. NPDC004752]
MRQRPGDGLLELLEIRRVLEAHAAALIALVEVFRSRGSDYDVCANEAVRRSSDAGHRAMAEAISARDPAAAALATATHIAETERWLRHNRPQPT